MQHSFDELSGYSGNDSCQAVKKVRKLTCNMIFPLCQFAKTPLTSIPTQ